MKRNKHVSVKFTKREDIELLRSRSEKLKMPMAKMIIESIKLSEEIHMTRGKMATLEFLNRELFKEYFESRKK